MITKEQYLEAQRIIDAYEEQLRIAIVSNCRHYVKNWDAERGTYLCSGCGKDFTK